MSVESYENSFKTLKALSETLCTLGEDSGSSDGFLKIDKQLLSTHGDTFIFHLYELDEVVKKIIKADKFSTR